MILARQEGGLISLCLVCFSGGIEFKNEKMVLLRITTEFNNEL